MNNIWGIVVIVWLVSVFGGLAFSEYNKSQCRIEAIKTGVTVNDAKELCK